MSDPRDVSGVWYGRYAADQDDEHNSFIAVFEEAGGAFTGAITEPDEEQGGIRRASARGRRNGALLRFTKQYDGTGGWVHAVRYAGTVDAEGVVIAGTWLVEGLTGGFTMEREKFDVEELEAEDDVEIVEPVAQFWRPR